MDADLQDFDRALLEAPNICHVSTLRPDGTIHSVAAWCDLDGDEVVLNSAAGRFWPENLQRTGRATLLVTDAQDPERYVSITGRLSEATQEGAEDVAHALAKKYLGQDRFPIAPGQQRVTLRIVPERIHRRRP